MISASKPKEDRYYNSGCGAHFLLSGSASLHRPYSGLLGLAFLRPHVDYYLLLPLFVICLLVGLYGWRRGGKVFRRT
jgi:hypothetical protein